MCFLFMNNVFADDLDLTISANTDKTEVVKGSQASILVNLKSSNEDIAFCQFKIEQDSNLELVSKSEANGWKISQEGATGIILETNSVADGLISSGMNIMELKYTVNGNGTVTIKTVECVTNDEEISGTYDDVSVSFTTKDLSSDTTLKSLKVTGGSINSFNSTGYEGQLIILDGPSFSLEMETTNPDYQDDIVVTSSDGTVLDPSNMKFVDPTNQGMMEIKITVNKVTTYTIGVKYENQELDNSLSYLKVNGVDVTLEAGKVNYTVKISSSATNIKVNASLKDSTNFKFEDGDGEWEYNIGSVAIPISIVPKDTSSGGEAVTYVITIQKEGAAAASSSSNKSSSAASSSSSSITNPQTGGISMFIMAIILISSLIGSVFIYQKNIEGYK